MNRKLAKSIVLLLVRYGFRFSPRFATGFDLFKVERRMFETEHTHVTGELVSDKIG